MSEFWLYIYVHVGVACIQRGRACKFSGEGEAARRTAKGCGATLQPYYSTQNEEGTCVGSDKISLLHDLY